MKLRIWRADPQASGEQGAFVSYEVDTYPDMVVLDAILAIQRTIAPDLAVRWNCKAGRCGSCSAEINGTPSLLCGVPMTSFAPNDVLTITPLKTFPLVKDLVTDLTGAYETAAKIPAFVRREGASPAAPEDLERLQDFRKCIECFLCQDACHVLRDHGRHEDFAGPRHLVHLATLDMHPLDTVDRRGIIKDTFGLGYCNVTRCCTAVCPVGIAITDDAIIPLKERVADAFYDPVRRVWERVFPPKHKRSLPLLQGKDSE